MSELEPSLPLEFIVYGTPVSLQSANSRAKTEWKELIVSACKPKLPGFHFAIVLWGFANFVVAYFLIARVGEFDVRAIDNIAASGLGVLVMGLVAARAFGRFHGGNTPVTPPTK